MNEQQVIPIELIREARERIKDVAIRTPLVRLNVSDAPAEIYLKLENLQPIGSFKLRGAINAMRLTEPERLANGVWTASTGNMAQGVAYGARELGIRCTVVLPDNAPQGKLDAIADLGAETFKIPRADWFDLIIFNKPYAGLGPEITRGVFIHPASDRDVMAGQGTIGLEIIEDLPDVDAVITPYGGGGLTCGVASAVRAVKSDTRIYACELDTGAPLAPSLEAGKPVTIEPRPAPAFAEGFSGAPSVIADVWPMVSSLLDGSLVMSVADLASTIKLLVERNHIVAEGAGAAPVAVALQGKAGGGKIACVVSGGHIDSGDLATILNGDLPQ